MGMTNTIKVYKKGTSEVVTIDPNKFDETRHTIIRQEVKKPLVREEASKLSTPTVKRRVTRRTTGSKK